MAIPANIITSNIYTGAPSSRESSGIDFSDFIRPLPGTYVLSSIEGLGEHRFIGSLAALNNGFSEVTEQDLENIDFQYGRGPSLIVRETVENGWSGRTISEYDTLMDETDLPPRGGLEPEPDIDFTEPEGSEMDLSDAIDDVTPVSLPTGFGPGARPRVPGGTVPDGFGPGSGPSGDSSGDFPFSDVEFDNTEIIEVESDNILVRKLIFDFYQEKADRLRSLYGADNSPLSLPFITLPPASRLSYNIEAQNKIQNNIIGYSSLSSLGEPVIEDLNVSSQGGTLTVGTTSETEIVEDVGGVTSFARGVDRSETGASRGTRTVDSDTASVARSY